MNFKTLKAALVGLILSVSGLANAGLITVENWHDTSDGFSGLKMSNFSDDIFYAVSLTGQFNTADTYEMLDGYHWASESEYLSAWAARDLVNGDFLTDNTPHPYYNQGGWSGYQWNGINRSQITFSDSHLTGRSTHAGTIEGYTSNWATAYTQQNALINNWAGFVLVKDSHQVPEPSTLAIFALGIMGLASRRFKKK